MKEVFWEKSYKNKKISTFGKPSKEVEGLMAKLSKGSSILDMACGEGRHGLFLAQNGFQVDAFDISENGIDKLKRLAVENDVKLNAWVEDIENFKFIKKYDVIISHGLFQFIKKNLRERVIRDMKEHTKPGGHNIIAVFTNTLELPEDLAPYMIGVFQEAEILEYYKDWIVEDFQSYVFEDEHENNIRHTHSINKLVVKKSSDV